MKRYRQMSFRRNRAVVWFVVSALWVTVLPGFAQDEESEWVPAENEEIESMLFEGTNKVAGTVACGDDYVQGRFEDLVSYHQEKRDGYSTWRLKTDGATCLAASSHNCHDQTRVVLKFASDTGTNINSTVSRWLSTAALAEVLGLEVKINFNNAGGSWPMCQVDQVIVIR